MVLLRLRCGTSVHLTGGVLVCKMGLTVHFPTMVRGSGHNGSVSTPGEPCVDSEDRAACSVLQVAVQLGPG